MGDVSRSEFIKSLAGLFGAAAIAENLAMSYAPAPAPSVCATSTTFRTAYWDKSHQMVSITETNGSRITQTSIPAEQFVPQAGMLIVSGDV